MTARLSIRAIPAYFEVRPLAALDPAKDRVTCGACGLSWDDAIPTSYTPAPSARCPFEAWHVDEDAPPGPAVRFEVLCYRPDEDRPHWRAKERTRERAESLADAYRKGAALVGRSLRVEVKAL